MLALLALCCAAPQWLGPPPPAAPQRIVSLAPSATEVLFALGVGDRVVGVTRFDDTPAAVLALPKIGGLINPDLEAVMALHPDLVVAIPTSGGRQRIDALGRLGLTVVVLPAQSLADLWEAIAALGKATGRPGAAAALTTRLQDALRTNQHPPGKAMPRAMVVVGHRPLVVAGPGTFLDELLRAAGAHNVVRRGGAFPVLDMEAAAGLDPDVIIDVADDDATPAARFWAGAPLLRAVRQGRVSAIRDAAMVRPGPRLPRALELLAAALYPAHAPPAAGIAP